MSINHIYFTKEEIKAQKIEALTWWETVPTVNKQELTALIIDPKVSYKLLIPDQIRMIWIWYKNK